MHRISALLCLLGVFSLSVVVSAQSSTTTPAACSSGACCDSNGFVKSAGSFCGTVDACNKPSSCDGVSSSCTQQYYPSSTHCSGAADTCHADGMCNGAGTCLPQQAYPDQTQCAPANAAQCKTARKCLSGSCQAATAAAANSVCSPNTTVCENPGVCDGSTFTCGYRSGAGTNAICQYGDADNCKLQVNCHPALSSSNPNAHNYGSSQYMYSIKCDPSTSWAGPSAQCRVTECGVFHCSGTGYGCPSTTDSNDANGGADCTPTSGACTGTQSATCNDDGTCGSCTDKSTGSNSDPLITGFNGQRFWMLGDSGSIYNMFTQPQLSINALIINAHAIGESAQTVQGQIGLQTKSNKILINPIDGKAGKIVVNGKTVQFSSKQNLVDLEDCVQLAWSPKSVMLTSAEFEIVVAFMDVNPKEDLNIAYLNLKLVHVSGDVTKMEGVIGQTAHVALRAAGLDYTWSDFQVTDIFATDDLKSTFVGADVACEDATVSKRNIGKFEAATRHEMDDLLHYSNTNS